ncbi:MAG: site-specific integrase [Bacteroidetes bacterium]|nr:site-specific integrase [Bacteroidota bacterium]
MLTPTCKPVLNWRNKIRTSKTYPIHLRITIDRISRYFPIELPQKIKLDQWSGKEYSWIKNTHPFAFEINNTIKEKIEMFNDLVRRCFANKKSVTFPLVLKELQKTHNTNLFNEYFTDIIKDTPESLELATLKRYRSCQAILNRFNASITFNDLSEDLFLRFKKYCENEGHLAGSTINSYFNVLKKVINWARKDGHITKAHQESIFEDVHIKIGKPKKDHLEIEEIQALKNFKFSEKAKSLERDRDLFMLQIYTGFYYNDLKELLKADLKKDPQHGYYLNASRSKNGNLAIVPLWKFPNAIDLIRKYECKNSKDKFLLDRKYFMYNQVYNRRLKLIAEQLGWERNMYNKLARNTNSQLYIRFGAERPIVSKMMGHEREETTNSYYEVNIRDVIEGTRNVNFDNLQL